MELRQVRYFLGVARAGTFGRAADELHVAKSALSKQIKLLEDELGADLLLRGGGRREVELTPAGEAFIQEAVTIVEAMDHGRERVKGIGGVTRGKVNIVVAQGWDAWPGWNEMVTAFHAQHPELAIGVTQADSIERILTMISLGDADLAVLADTEPPVVPGITVEVLHTEPMCVCMGADHEFAEDETVTLADLRDEQWLLPPIELALVTRVAADHDFVPIVEAATPTPTMVRSLVIAGVGIGICGVSEAGFYAPAVAREIEPRITVSIMLAYRSTYRTAATRAARDFLRACFGHGAFDEAEPT